MVVGLREVKWAPALLSILYIRNTSLTNRVLNLRDIANHTTPSEMNFAFRSVGNGNCVNTSVRWKPHFSPFTLYLKNNSMESESNTSRGNLSPTSPPFWSLHNTVTAENLSFSAMGIPSQWYFNRSSACGTQASSESKVRNNSPWASCTPRLNAAGLPWFSW